MKTDKVKIVDFFKAKGFMACNFPKTEKKKNPDFEIYLNDKIWAYCELKSIVKDEWVNNVMQSDTMEGQRNTPTTYNRIQKKIHEACKQLVSVNPKHHIPNIIIFVNHEKYCGGEDLHLVIKGKILTAEGAVDFDHEFRNRLLKQGDLLIADLIIWLDIDRISPYYSVLKESQYYDKMTQFINIKNNVDNPVI